MGKMPFRKSLLRMEEKSEEGSSRYAGFRDVQQQRKELRGVSISRDTGRRGRVHLA